MNRAYSELMTAHRKNIKSPGFFSSQSALQIARHAEELFQSGVECLNLENIPKGLKKSKGYESAIMLKEIFDRIELPPYKNIPDDKAIEAESDNEKRA
jgi:MscS family membrane protein